MFTSKACGFTLIELLVFIVIVGIALAGVLSTYDFAVRDSADPAVRKQALAIAESLLQEVQQMSFTYCDPDDPAVTTATTPADCAMAEASGPETGETRYGPGAPFDNVNDYHGYNTAADVPPGVKDITGTPIAELAAYNAQITVVDATLPGLAAGDALRVAVVVSGPGNVTVRLDGYRTRYAPQL